MSREEKFSFIPENQIHPINSGYSYTITLMKNGSLYFPKEVLHIYDLEGRFIKFYADKEKKSIGWKLFDKETELEGLKKIRKIKKNSLGSYTPMIKKLLDYIGYEVKSTVSKIEVKTYKSSYFEGEIFYIQL